jgi:hypothetical protein
LACVEGGASVDRGRRRRLLCALLATGALWQACAGMRRASPAPPAGDVGEAPPRLTAAQAESRARDTEIVRVFLDRYAPCEGCSFREDPGAPEHRGCVSYRVRESCPGDHSECPEFVWVVDYWVGPACPFRYQPTEFPVSVSVDPVTGSIVAARPSFESVATTDACESDADCRCLSGSGVPFVGCANRFHASMNATGSSACESCVCVARECRAPVGGLPAPAAGQSDRNN